MKKQLGLMFIMVLLAQARPAWAQPEVDASVVYLGASGSVCQFRTGSGSPEGAVTAPTCSVYMRTDGGLGTTLYVKKSGSGNTGWQAMYGAGDTPSFAGLSFSGDVIFGRDAANIGYMRNGSNTQTLRIGPSSAGLEIVGGSAGELYTRLDAPLRWGRNNATQWELVSGGHFGASADNTYDIGASGANRPRTGYFGTSVFTPKLTSAGDIELDPVGNDVVPATNYDITLGASDKKFKVLHAAELVVDTLVRQNVVATVGGRVMVTETAVLGAPLTSGQTAMYTTSNPFANGDRVVMEANGQVEWLAITTSSVDIGGGLYAYGLTRNLDGSGANDWPVGSAIAGTGGSGDGFLDLYAGSGVLSGAGPSVVANVRTGTDYNDIEPRSAFGNLNGICDYATAVFGLFAGDCAAANVTVDATNGFRIRYGTTDKVVIDPSGNATFDGDLDAGSVGGCTIADGEIVCGTGDDVAALSSDDATCRLWIGDAVCAAAPFRVDKAGNATMAGATITDSDITLGSDSGYVSSNALKFARDTMTYGFGQAGDRFALWTINAGNSQHMYIENTIVGTTGPGALDGVAYTNMSATGWDESAGGGVAYVGAAVSVESNPLLARSRVTLNASGEQIVYQGGDLFSANVGNLGTPSARWDRVYATGYYGTSGTVDVNNGATQTMFSITNIGLYLVFVDYGSTGYQAYAMVGYNGSGASLLNTASGVPQLVISTSGADVRVTQTSGSNLTGIVWRYVRIS